MRIGYSLRTVFPGGGKKEMKVARLFFEIANNFRGHTLWDFARMKTTEHILRVDIAIQVIFRKNLWISMPVQFFF